MAETGTWTSVLVAASVCSLASGVLAKFVLVPMRKRLAVMRKVAA